MTPVDRSRRENGNPLQNGDFMETAGIEPAQDSPRGDVDLRCAVKFTALPMRRLPIRGFVWVPDRSRDACARRPPSRKGHTPGNKGKTYPPEPLTLDEVLRLLAACPGTPQGVRDRALYVVLWRSGLRISEALALELRDLDPARGTLHVRCGKGSKARFSGLDAQAFAEIQPWLDLRSNYPAGPVFCVVNPPTSGGSIRPVQVRTTLHALGALAGIAKRVHPHGFRHTHACELASEMPIHYVQRQLGHSSLATTANYLAGIAPTEVLGAISQRGWSS